MRRSPAEACVAKGFFFFELKFALFFSSAIVREKSFQC